MNTLKVHKSVFCDFLITYEKPDMQGLLSSLQIGYSLDPEHLDIVFNHLNMYFLGIFHKKWKKCLFPKSQFEKWFGKWLNTFIVTFSGIRAKGGRKSYCMKFKEASTAIKRRKLMSIKENFMAAEIQDAFKIIYLHFEIKYGLNGLSADAKYIYKGTLSTRHHQFLPDW